MGAEKIQQRFNFIQMTDHQVTPRESFSRLLVLVVVTANTHGIGRPGSYGSVRVSFGRRQ